MEAPHVNVVGKAAGISRPRLDDGDVTRELDGDESVVAEHLACAVRLGHTFVHRVVGQDVYVVPVHAGGLGHFQLFQVARESGLRKF